MTDNKIHIDADALEVHLEGEADYVEEAYETLRPRIMERLEQSLARAEGDPTPEPSLEPRTDRDPDETSPMFEVDPEPTPGIREATSPEQAPHFVVCTDLCYSLANLHRDEFDQSIFGDLIDYDTIAVLYTSHEAAQQLEEQIQFGDTLWRELTSEGMAAISDDGESS